jgi:glutathione S-transferase
MILYDYLDSGNGYKTRLLMSLLGINYRFVPIDIMAGESRQPEHLARNPLGKIPVLEVEEGRYLAESNAILLYLADGSRFLPDDRWLRAQVYQWLFFEQYSHEPNIAVARFWLNHTDIDEPKSSLLPEKHAAGYRALDVMEQTLADADFLVGGAYSIADIALYAYTHVAGEGGFDLASYSGIRNWLSRIGAVPGHIPITQAEPA